MSLNFSKNVLNRETIKREVAHQAQNVWEKRLGLVELKQKCLSLGRVISCPSQAQESRRQLGVTSFCACGSCYSSKGANSHGPEPDRMRTSKADGWGSSLGGSDQRKFSIVLVARRDR
jgi:hypothetical protein